MTPTQAQQIWNACYGNDTTWDGWATYTSEQRALAMDVLQQEHDRQRGGWGVWNVSDRH
jgi:hypothetical protein